jgi:hypothetical protein
MMSEVKVVAVPVSMPTPPAARRFNQRALELFGRNRIGGPHFRAVNGAVETWVTNGTMTMRYPANEPMELKMRCTILVDGTHVEVPLDPREYPPELEPHKNAPVSVHYWYEQRGDPFWIVEGYRPPSRVCLNWDASLGPEPREGEYLPMWWCKTPRGEARLPDDSDLERLQRLVREQAANPDLRNVGWEDDLDPGLTARRVERMKRRHVEQQEAALARDEERACEVIRHYWAARGRSYSFGG